MSKESPLYMDQEGMMKHMENLIRDDRALELMSFLRNQRRDGYEVARMDASELFLLKLLKLICCHCATGCASSLLKENFGFYLDANLPLEDGMLPLQLAAQTLSFGLTSTLLSHGADANANVHVQCDLPMLPLKLALKALSDQWTRDWSPSKSIFKLIYIFCLPDFEEPLQTIRLLAERTKDIDEISLYLVEEGEVVQLAALLLVTWSRLVPQNTTNSLIGQHIWLQIIDIFNQEVQLMIDCGPDCQVLERLKPKKIKLLSQWKFLQVWQFARPLFVEIRYLWKFENSPDYMLPYFVANFLYDNTQLKLKPDDMHSDDIECLRPKLATVEKDELNKAIEKQMQLWSVSPTPKTRYTDQSQLSLMKELLIRSEASPVAERWSGFCSMLPSRSLYSSRQYHTWEDMNTKIGKVVDKSVARNNSKLWVSASPSAKICGRLILCAKRIMK